MPGLLVGQLYHYVDDFDLDGSIDIGSTTKIEGETACSGRRRTEAINFVRIIKSSTMWDPSGTQVLGRVALF